MKFPENYKYAKSHEWVDFEDETTARIGLTDFAQNEMGELVFVGLPDVGEPLVAGDILGYVESVKTVSDVYAPVTGVVKEINEALLDSPEAINSDANKAWLVKIGEITEQEELMDAAAYRAFIA